MFEVKIFAEDNEKVLEHHVNNFLKCLSVEKKEVYEIKYAQSRNVFEGSEELLFSVLIMYKRKEEL